jgi:hypothetical protein
MDLNFETEAANASGVAPVLASQLWNVGTADDAQTSVAGIWQAEQDRLLRQAYRRLHACPGVDVESVVSDVLVWAMEHAGEFNDADHCRKAMAVTCRNFAMHALRGLKRNVEADGNLPDARTLPEQTTVMDTTVTWLFGLCADDTERRILKIWMQPGNETEQATAEATAKWSQPWSRLEVRALMARLRARAGAALDADSRRMLRVPMTKGTMPGLHCERFRTLGCVLLLATGGRPVLSGGMPLQTVPALRWVDGAWVGEWEGVPSCV